MPDWIRNSPLKACSPIRETLGLVVRELPHSGKLSLQARGEIAEINRRVSRVIGQGLPLASNTATNSDQAVLWLAPRKWLILLDADLLPGIQQQLIEALDPFPCLVSDLSDARFGIEVGGVNARDLLAKVCALDLDVRSFGPGRCAQSLLVRIPLLLCQVDDRPTFHLYVDRSLARYAWDWLADAALEFAERVPSQ